MIATYAAALAVCGASLAIGQAAISLCGVRRWSWLAPAAGLALALALCWGALSLTGSGTAAAIALLALTVAAIARLRGRVEGGEEALRQGLPVSLVALLAASLPFAAAGHFGILGTGFNPDMSQHLLATERLAADSGSRLLSEGYPLGPHALVVALGAGLGIGTVQGFSGLTIAVAILAPLTALAAFSGRPRLSSSAAALLIGLPYLVATYFAQGAIKETIQALFVLAFVLALREASANPAWRSLSLRFVPAALVAVGSVYAYSFPGLVWMVGALTVWLALERALPLRPLLPAALVFALGALPELGRMIEFQRFETFDPAGPGLGNLFGQVSPFTALGIWPSGDFRVAPGGGAAPAIAFYLGAAFAGALLLAGLARAWGGRERALIAGVLAVAGVYIAARLGGTPYTAAKALAVAAPVLTLAILAPGTEGAGRRGPSLARGAPRHRTSAVYVLLAAACSLLAFANAPVGPTSYSPALASLRPLLSTGPALVLAPRSLLEDEQGHRYLAWELRGGRVCIEPEDERGTEAPPGVRFVVTSGSGDLPPFDRLDLRRRAGPYVVWERHGVRGGPDPCPLIDVRQAHRD